MNIKKFFEVKDRNEFDDFVVGVEGLPGYVRAQAFGIGLATMSKAGDLLDTWFPFPNYKQNYGTAAVLASVVGHLAGTMTYRFTDDFVSHSLRLLAPFLDDGHKHPNIEVLRDLRSVASANRRVVVVTFIDEEREGPKEISDIYLRWHLQSHRIVRPGYFSMVGVDEILPVLSWTSEGPVAEKDLLQRKIDSMKFLLPLRIFSVDKYPQLINYHVPSQVTIKEGAYVELGAYLGKGSVVEAEECVYRNESVYATD